MKCSCGLAAQNVFVTFERVENELKKEKPDLWRFKDTLDDNILGWIPDMEKKCGLDLGKEKEMLKEAERLAIDKKWDDVMEKVRLSDFKIYRKLLDCAMKERTAKDE